MGSVDVFTSFLTPILDVGKQSASRPDRFTTGVTAPVTHCAGGNVGPRVGLEPVKRKVSKPSPESNLDSSLIQTAA
jgi:hypothetical protein